VTARTRREATSIYGVGAVTGYGWGSKLLWEGLVTGESAVRLTPGYGSHFDTDQIYVSRIPEGGNPSDGSSRYIRAMASVAREAIEDALSRGWRPGPVVGFIHATAIGEVDLWKDFYALHAGQGERSRKQYLELLPSTSASNVMQEHGFHGPCMGVNAMCASASSALLTAKMWLEAGVATDVVVVDSDISATPEHVRNMHDLGVTIVDTDGPTSCRPFSPSSRGFNFGEASVGFVVSRGTSSAYATILGGAMSNDAYHVVSVAPDHLDIKRCVTTALADAGIGSADIAYLNAHATGTKQCDAAETDVLDSLLPRADAYGTKPMTGHCLGASAAVELAIACMSYQDGMIPAPSAAVDAHPRLMDGPAARRPGPTLKLALGMGGHNGALVLDEP